MPFCSETCIVFVRSQNAIASAGPAAQERDMHLVPIILNPVLTNHSYRLLRSWYIESIEELAHRTDNNAVVRFCLAGRLMSGPVSYLDTSDLAVTTSFSRPSSCPHIGGGVSV